MLHATPLRFLLATAAAAAILGFGQLGFSQPEGMPRSEASRSRGVAVVELFTSQGCSSCPPADRLLEAIDAVASEQGLPVYVLSMHVDYWNSLGWADPYSSRQFSQRQRRYAGAANSNRVYTPQMIVNGGAGFTGSRRADAQAALREALASSPAATINLGVQASDARSWSVDYRVAGASADSELVVCLVADAAASRVPRGENAGRQLAHAGVVRTLVRQPLGAATGKLQLAWPTDQPASDQPMSVVAFVQDATTMEVYGAAKWSPES